MKIKTCETAKELSIAKSWARTPITVDPRSEEHVPEPTTLENTLSKRVEAISISSKDEPEAKKRKLSSEEDELEKLENEVKDPTHDPKNLMILKFL